MNSNCVSLTFYFKNGTKINTQMPRDGLSNTEWLNTEIYITENSSWIFETDIRSLSIDPNEVIMIEAS
jgi:hypothetical protein